VVERQETEVEDERETESISGERRDSGLLAGVGHFWIDVLVHG